MVQSMYGHMVVHSNFLGYITKWLQMACTWFGEIWFYCCLPLLPQLACNILATTCAMWPRGWFTVSFICDSPLFSWLGWPIWIHLEIVNKHIVRFSLMQNDKWGHVTSGEKGYAEFLIFTALFLKLGESETDLFLFPSCTEIISHCTKRQCTLKQICQCACYPTKMASRLIDPLLCHSIHQYIKSSCGLLGAGAANGWSRAEPMSLRWLWTTSLTLRGVACLRHWLQIREQNFLNTSISY